MKTVVHVNQHIIRRNSKTGAREPVLTVKTYKDNRYAHRVRFTGPCEVVYQPMTRSLAGPECGSKPITRWRWSDVHAND